MSTAFTQVTAVPLDGALPPQNTGTAGKALISNGTTAGWNTILSMIGNGSGQTVGTAVANAILPTQTGNNGKYLSTDGSGNLSWVTPSTAVAGVSSITINGTAYTGAVTITNVPSATTASTLSATLPLSLGGTGATSAAGALSAIGAAAANHTHNYAPIDSPVFTGNPVAPTPATTDNDTSIATTAYVKSVVSSGVGVGFTTALAPAGLTIGSVYTYDNFFLASPYTAGARIDFGSGFGSWKIISAGPTFLADFGTGVGSYGIYLIQRV